MCSPPEVRWGILGTGAICNDFVQALRSTSGARVSAVAARELASAQQFAQRNGLAVGAARASYGALLRPENPADKVDIVYIGVIHPHHRRWAQEAIENGLHVLVEKPMTCSARATRELVALARKHNVLLAEAMWTRFFPLVKQAKALVESGALGAVRGFQGDFGFRLDGVDSPDAAAAHRLTAGVLGGGATLDIGVYPIAGMMMAFGGLTSGGRSAEKSNEKQWRVAATGTLNSEGVDKSVAVAVVHEGTGQVASLSWTIECQTPEEWRILCTQGSITFQSPAHVPLRMTVSRPGADPRNDPPTVEVFETPLPTLIDGALPLNFPGSEGFVFQAETVTAAVRDGRRELEEFTLDESVTMAEICDDVLAQVGVKYPDSVYN
jgi:dihydrodiol dehydrogenase / D-xylose 1-dehydrogenase (NADP)